MDVEFGLQRGGQRVPWGVQLHLTTEKKIEICSYQGQVHGSKEAGKTQGAV